VKLSNVLGTSLAELRERPLRPVQVAVLDTGIDSTHPDLEGRVSEAFRIEQCDGRYRAVTSGVSQNNDHFGHGTGVASVIAGIAPNAELIDIQMVGSDNLEIAEALLSGFQLALLRHFSILNFSLACHSKFLTPMIELCEAAYWQSQIVVAARRNMPLLDHGIPAQLSSCIGVDSDDFPSPFHFQFRDRHPVECVARGHQIEVAAPGGQYTVQSGTSFATPVVTGICALLLGAEPTLSPFEIKSALKSLAAD
jgi:hypothetical protein